MIHLSVIIPVYNGESYITRCLTSIFSQTNFDFTFEVIAVNDGSKDNSLALLTSIKENYENLYIFDQNNGGAGSARNIGINNAKGNFIWFIDADDYIQPNAFSTIQQFILKDDFYKGTLGFNHYNVTSAGLLQPDKDSDHKEVEIFNGLEYVKPAKNLITCGYFFIIKNL
jgi:glycosyltransferase involved in cell wall biosynthesis